MGIKIERFELTNVLLDITQDVRGSGKEHDPIRPIRQFRTKDGKLVAEFDPWGAFYNEKTGNWVVPTDTLVEYGGEYEIIKERFEEEFGSMPPQGDLVLNITESGKYIIAPLNPGESRICPECNHEYKGKDPIA